VHPLAKGTSGTDNKYRHSGYMMKMLALCLFQIFEEVSMMRDVKDF
jgi:hypothetical protein